MTHVGCHIPGKDDNNTYLGPCREKDAGVEREEAGAAIKNPSAVQPRRTATTANASISLFASMIGVA